jgi:hypothetical protein
MVIRFISTNAITMGLATCAARHFLKGAQVWDLDLLDSNDFYIMKSLKEGDLRAEIKFLHLLQMG